MFSKIIQPTLRNFPSNYLSYDAKYLICEGSEKSLKLWPFLINAYLLLFSWEKGFSNGSGVTECTCAINATQRLFNDLWWVNALTDDIFASVMASNTVDGL